MGAEVGQQWAEGQIKGGGGEGAHSSSLCISSSYQYVSNGRAMTGTQRVLPRERWGHLRTSDYFSAKKIITQKEIKHRTSGSFFISSPLWAKGWAFCHSKATRGDSWEPQCVIESQLSLPPEALGDPRALFFREGM